MNNGLAQLPIGNLAAHQENLSLLALPPPIASPSIAGGPTNLPRAHQLALPGPASYMNPPAPKYPPPPGFAKALPPPQDLLPPIYFNKAGMPQLPALPSFEPQPKVATPPVAVGGGGHLGGMRAISPRNAGAKPPPPAILPPTMASTPPPPMDEGSSEVRGLGGPPPPAHPKPPPGPPGMSTEGSHFAVREERDFCVLDGSRRSGSEASRSPSRTPVEEIPDLFAGEGGRDEVSSEEGGALSGAEEDIEEDANERIRNVEPCLADGGDLHDEVGFAEGEHTMQPPPPPPPGPPGRVFCSR